MVKLNTRKSIFDYINKNNKLYKGIFEIWHHKMVLYLIL